MKSALILLFCIVPFSCSSSDPTNGDAGTSDTAQPPAENPNTDPIPRYSYTIVNRYAHDPEAFTQGLVYENGFLYEGTGMRGSSSLRRVELESGRVLQLHTLSDDHFGEGITIFDNRIFQLTFTSGVGFIYDKEDFSRLDSVVYPTEGWGLTHDGTQLIMSDGTDILYRRDPATFAEMGVIAVTENGKPLDQLNELEYVNGEIYANLWTSDLLARISPQSGKVVGWIDLRDLLTADERRDTDVLNGIAYDPDTKRLFVTGKLWPWLFEIELVPEQ